ncbi:hypothetical protein Z045_05845 [Rhodococcus pyridinivorans KG-16]|uniref:Recombinase RecT n=1 Tax=Rhodococcus pyridinivorans KG-16 TaxID=1441730 RepID=A0A0V9UNV5_9NOCA|nr:hypothetical protein [Rhodococcus pyridinivorans]KSZ59688.1 hypothetical protein Z045_05845 [Rhodococcus pyridinivorans KG-16]
MEASQDDHSIDAGTLDRYNDENGSSAIAIRSLDDIRRISNIFIGSGMFKGDKSLSQAQQMYQAGVKIIAGVEFGIQPFAAMRGINIINGNAEMSANLMAAKVKKHPKYDYKVKQLDNDGCVITFYEIPYPNAPRKEWEALGDSSFTHEDAVAAQLANSQNWRKFARNMYFARAMSNGVRFYTPDVFYGAPVYVEGEISGEFEGVKETTPNPSPQPEASTTASEPVAEDKEPQEAEVVTTTDEPTDDAPEEESLEWLHEEIAEVARRKGYGTDWVMNAIDKATTIPIAKGVIRKLNETKDAA